MDLELVRAVLEGIALRVHLTWELARLAGGNEPGTKTIGNGSADEKAPRLGADDLVDAHAEKVVDHRVNAGGQAMLVGDERRDVLEDDARLGIVGNVDDEVLVGKRPILRI